ncbi:MAG: hypothetical protein GX190_03735 [Mollicutes bacterium]|jgi:hypothetical protein|nr:hypothetical protein [Mollicutes bacterium]
MASKKNKLNTKKSKLKHKVKYKPKSLININFKLFTFITFLTAVLLIIASYAWFSTSLNVRIKFFDLVVSTDTGLFISLDGVNFSESVEVSVDSVIRDLRETYPNHTNQWASGGMWPVSTNGIRNSNADKFDIFLGEIRRPRGRNNPEGESYLNTSRLEENKSSAANLFVSFDIFLKNVSGSPYPDNLYFNEDTYIDFEEDVDDETRESMSGIMNSLRMGIIKIGSVSSNTDVYTIQNIQCNNSCEMIIYEPNHLRHSQVSIEKASELGIELVDGVYFPTYAVIKEGTRLKHMSGQDGTGIPLDTEHFALQQTIFEEDLERPIFQIPNGITKMRVYVWIEGQDVDSLETHSPGAPIYISIGLEKDLAGYEAYD